MMGMMIVMVMIKMMIKTDSDDTDDNESQVKSAPTPVGEPNVRAETEKENKDTPETVQPTGVSQKT